MATTSSGIVAGSGELGLDVFDVMRLISGRRPRNNDDLIALCRIPDFVDPNDTETHAALLDPSVD
jgi:hypothetical protein